MAGLNNLYSTSGTFLRSYIEASKSVADLGWPLRSAIFQVFFATKSSLPKINIPLVDELCPLFLQYDVNMFSS